MDTVTRSLLVLATATFVMVTSEMLPLAVLPLMAADLAVPTERVGILVSAWALAVVVLSLPLVRLTARAPRRTVLAVAMTVLAASAALTAAADGYALVLAARLLGAAACGLLWAGVNAHTAGLVAPDRLPRAVAVVLGGATLGTVVGVPLAGLVAEGLGWRPAFAGLAVLAAGSALAVRVAVVPGPPTRGAAPADATPARAALGRVATLAGLTGLLLVGHFAAYTFVTELLGTPAAALPGGMPGLLLLLGLASAGGLVVVGRLPGSRVGAGLTTSAGVTALALLAVPGAVRHPASTVAVVVVWGAASGALPALAQTQIMARAGERLRTTAGALIPVVLNLGIAVGAAAGSALVARGGPMALPVPAAVVVALAAGGFAAAHARTRRATALPASVSTKTATATASVRPQSRAPIGAESNQVCMNGA